MALTNNQTVGVTGEALVAAEFARRGFTVGFLTGNAKDVDLLVYQDGFQIAVQVKTVKSGALQYDFGKFVDSEYHKETKQRTINGAKSDLDRSICFVVVFLGKKTGEDRFYFTTLGRFADYVAESTKRYFERHGGVRPGKTSDSRHGATKESEFPSGLFMSLDAFLTRSVTDL